MKKLVLLIITTTYLSCAAAQNVNNVFRDNYFYPNQSCANIWGYVDSLGNEYALVGASQGLSIVNVTNPDSIWQVKQIQWAVQNSSSLWKEIRTYGHYAYITSEAGHGLQIVNLGNLPDTVTPHTYWQPIIGTSQLNKIHALHIDTASGYIYLYGCNGGFTGTVIAELVNPVNPTYKGKYTDEYIHDGFVRNNILYAGRIYAGNVAIINVINPTNPILLQSQQTPGNFTHNTWLSDDNKYMFTTDEISNSFLTCYDVSDFNNIELMDKIQSNPGSNSIVHNTYYKNGYAFTSWYKDGYTIVDAHRPNNLVQVGNYDAFSGSGNGFSGTWGVYGYLPSGNVLLSNIDTSDANEVGALTVVTPTLQRACYLEGTVTDSLTNLPLSGVAISAVLNANTIADSTILGGTYAMGTVTAGSYNVTFTKTGYQTKTVNNVILTNSIVTNIMVKLYDGTAGISSVEDIKKSVSIVSKNNKNIDVIFAETNKLYNIKLYNINGLEVFQKSINHSQNIDLAAISEGVYFIKLVDKDNNFAIYKVVLH